MEQRNSQLEHNSQWSKQEACFAPATRCGSLSITIPVSFLANEFDACCVLHGQVSLAAVNLFFYNSRGYERLLKSKDSLKDCFENGNCKLVIMFMNI